MIKIGDSYFRRIDTLSLRDSSINSYLISIPKFSVCVNGSAVASFSTLKEAKQFLEETSRREDIDD